jgi:phage terminase small subunit
MTDTPRPDPPRHLSQESRALWRQLVADFDFEEHELKTLRLALEALDRASQARRAIKRLGMTYEDRFGQPHARPEVAIERDARASWLRLMGALDLPADEEEAGQPKTIRGQFGRKTPRGRGRVALAKAADHG